MDEVHDVGARDVVVTSIVGNVSNFGDASDIGISDTFAIDLVGNVCSTEVADNVGDVCNMELGVVGTVTVGDVSNFGDIGDAFAIDLNIMDSCNAGDDIIGIGDADFIGNMDICNAGELEVGDDLGDVVAIGTVGDMDIGEAGDMNGCATINAEHFNVIGNYDDIGTVIDAEFDTIDNIGTVVEAEYSTVGSGDTEEQIDHDDTAIQQTQHFKIVGDNIDKTVNPSFWRIESMSSSFHYFHYYAALDRIDVSGLSDLVPLGTLDIPKLLPSLQDIDLLKSHYITLISRYVSIMHSIWHVHLHVYIVEYW